MSETGLREVARARLASGVLPAAAPVRTWGGPGSGLPCALCDLAVRATDIEFEIDVAGAGDSRTLRFHRRCHAIWDLERRPDNRSWIPVTQSLPPPGVVVESRVRLGETRSVILDLRRDADVELHWTNATTGERLPANWCPVAWRARPSVEAPVQEAGPAVASDPAADEATDAPAVQRQDPRCA